MLRMQNPNKIITAPTIILVAPQLGENIGAAARAMHNFGCGDLRLVNPRDGWPNSAATEVARNSGKIIDDVRVFGSLREASADINRLYATSARPRDMVKKVVTPRICAAELRKATSEGNKCAIMFGPERSGLSNDELILADAIVTVPVSDENSSLNLAQAVSIACYEWFAAGNDTRPEEVLRIGESELATKSQISMLLDTLEINLDETGYFRTTDMRQRMLRNLSNIFSRNNLTAQEVKTLQGVVRSLRREQNLKKTEELYQSL